MFTGIVSAVAKLTAVDMRSEHPALQERILKMDVPYIDLALGESIAVNGVCLTVANLKRNENGSAIEFFVSPETCARTNIGALRPGDQTNLERALRLSDRLSGHLVQGHVDGLARLVSIEKVSDCYEIRVELDSSHLRYVIDKGSIALDGISLTVNTVRESTISLMIIPHTWEHTSLSSKQIGQSFNVELDMIAKYVSNFVKHK